MNGLEAIKLMEQGKMVKNGFYVYRLENETIKWITEETLKKGDYWKNEESFDINSKRFEEYKPKSITGWERVEKIEDIYYFGDDERVRSGVELFNKFDAEHYDRANYFSTKEKAEEIDFKQTLFRKLQRFSDENGGGDIDWNDFNQRKYYIFYDTDDLIPDYCWKYTGKNFGVVYFVSKEVTKQAVELFHDDLIKYFTM